MGADVEILTAPASSSPRPRGDRDERADAELLAALDPAAPLAARAALAELYARHAAAVRSFVRRRAPDPTVADDVLQDVFLAVARHGRGQRGGSIRAWLLAIALAALRDRLRGSRRRAHRERAAARDERVAPATPALLDDELEAALARLPAKLRAAVELRHAQGLPHPEVARALGVSLRTAKTWSAQGLERLRALLDGDRR